MNDYEAAIKEIDKKMEEIKVLYEGKTNTKSKIATFLYGLLPARKKDVVEINKNMLGFSYGLLQCNKDLMQLAKYIQEGRKEEPDKKDMMFG